MVCPQRLKRKPQSQLPTRELTEVLLITPNVGEVKLESGFPNCLWVAFNFVWNSTTRV
jgi:hypothetical protein